jgi:hypothetical protein
VDLHAVVHRRRVLQLTYRIPSLPSNPSPLPRSSQKVAEQAERYEEMVDEMTGASKLDGNLSVEERNL